MLYLAYLFTGPCYVFLFFTEDAIALFAGQYVRHPVVGDDGLTFALRTLQKSSNEDGDIVVGDDGPVDHGSIGKDGHSQSIASPLANGINSKIETDSNQDLPKILSSKQMIQAEKLEDIELKNDNNVVNNASPVVIVETPPLDGEERNGQCCVSHNVLFDYL